MMTKTTTYAHFKKFLESVGLRYERVEKSHVYREPDGEALMIFPEYRANQLVRLHHLIGMRRLLIERGYIEPEDFEQFLEQKETA